jgi:TM2 domain-containing membrane protein YozV
MNCLNHPEIPVAAFCQNCGKPLCSACVRQVAGITYCEPCLAARLATPHAAPAPGSYTVGVGDSGQFNYTASGPLPMPDSGPNPALATLLGFIPGVGAMYNGQFVKAMIHVLVFVLLITVTNEYGIFGVFIAAWVFYQVFDAHHTAKARRDGMPLPDPLGLNELGVRLGIQSPRQAQGYPAGNYPPGTYPPGGAYTPPASGAPYSPPNPAYTTTVGPDGNPTYTTVPPVPGTEPYAGPPPGYDPSIPPPPPAHPEPIGAIILIALGVLFLLGTMNIFHFSWIGHSWPLILIGLGVWIFIKRQRELPPGGGL